MSAISDPCRVLVGGVSNIYFTCVNTTDRVLSVPLTDPSADPARNLSLNFLYGDPLAPPPPAPPVNFAPGRSGFAVPESYFPRGGGWHLLGQNINIASDPPVCTDSGIPDACEVIDTQRLQGPFEYTRRVVLNLTKEALEAAKAGWWKGGGTWSVPYLKRGAKALAAMLRFLRYSKGQVFACEVTPLSCRTVKVPKRAFTRAFAKIFDGKVPKGLEHLQARAKREKKAFEAQLKALPEEYTTCQ